MVCFTGAYNCIIEVFTPKNIEMLKELINGILCHLIVYSNYLLAMGVLLLCYYLLQQLTIQIILKKYFKYLTCHGRIFAILLLSPSTIPDIPLRHCFEEEWPPLPIKKYLLPRSYTGPSLQATFNRQFIIHLLYYPRPKARLITWEDPQWYISRKAALEHLPHCTDVYIPQYQTIIHSKNNLDLLFDHLLLVFFLGALIVCIGLLQIYIFRNEIKTFFTIHSLVIAYVCLLKIFVIQRVIAFLVGEDNIQWLRELTTTNFHANVVTFILFFILSVCLCLFFIHAVDQKRHNYYVQINKTYEEARLFGHAREAPFVTFFDIIKWFIYVLGLIIRFLLLFCLFKILLISLFHILVLIAYVIVDSYGFRLQGGALVDSISCIFTLFIVNIFNIYICWGVREGKLNASLLSLALIIGLVIGWGFFFTPVLGKIRYFEGLEGSPQNFLSFNIFKDPNEFTMGLVSNLYL